MENIDVIFYINLEQRKDRDDHFKEEIQKLCRDTSKIRRVDAVYNDNGALGCTYSHINAIKEFEMNASWNTCIIFEDDFTFSEDDIDINNYKLSVFLTENKNWDIISLSYNPLCFITEDTDMECIKKVLNTQTSSGYCLNKSFALTLKNNFIEGILGNYALDVYWKRLQPISNWFATVPAMGYQYESYSDIEHRVTLYPH